MKLTFVKILSFLLGSLLVVTACTTGNVNSSQTDNSDEASHSESEEISLSDESTGISDSSLGADATQSSKSGSASNTTKTTKVVSTPGVVGQGSKKAIVENVTLEAMTDAVSALFSVAEADKSIAYDDNTLYRFNLRDVIKAAKAKGLSDKIEYDTVMMIAALQGIVNRDKIHLYIDYIGDGSVKFPNNSFKSFTNSTSPTSGDTDNFWFTELRKSGKLLSGYKVVNLTSIGKVVDLFRSFIKGAVVWDQGVISTSNVACTVAGVEDLLPMRYDTGLGVYDWFVRRNNIFSVQRNLVKLFTGSGTIPETSLQSSGSKKCDAYLWALELYLKSGKTSKTFMCSFMDAFSLSKTSVAYYDVENLCVINRDYYISNRCFFFDLSQWAEYLPNDDMKQPLGTDYATLCKILTAQNGIADGELVTVTGFTPWQYKYSDATLPNAPNAYACEGKFVETLSTYYMQLDASLFKGYANASVFQHMTLKSSYQQKCKTVNTTLNASKTYICIYLGDFDASNAVGGSMVSAYWNDPKRGQVPLAWGYDTYCEKNAPQALEYMYETQSDKDYFVMSDNGTGYMTQSSLMKSDRPNGLKGTVSSWVATAKKQFTKWDLSIGGFFNDMSNFPESNYHNSDPTYPQILKQNLQDVYASVAPDGAVFAIQPSANSNGVPCVKGGCGFFRTSRYKLYRMVYS